MYRAECQQKLWDKHCLESLRCNLKDEIVYQEPNGIDFVDRMWKRKTKTDINFKNLKLEIFDRQFISIFSDSENWRKIYHLLEQSEPWWLHQVKLDNSSVRGLSEIRAVYIHANEHARKHNSISIDRYNWKLIYCYNSKTKLRLNNSVDKIENAAHEILDKCFCLIKIRRL